MNMDLYILVSELIGKPIIAQDKLSKRQYAERYKKLFTQMVINGPSTLQEEEQYIAEIDIIGLYDSNSSILEIISISNNFSIIVLQNNNSGTNYIDIFYYYDYLRINKLKDSTLEDSTLEDSTFEDSTFEDSDAVTYALYLYFYYIIKQSYNLAPI